MSSVYATGLLLLLPLNLLYLSIPGMPAGNQGYELINLSAPMCFILVLTFMSYLVAARLPETIWSAAFWLPFQSAVFFGFGPLVEILGNEATRYSLSTHALSVSPAELLRANKLSTFGVTLLLMGFWLHMLSYPRSWREERRSVSPTIPPERLGIAFVLGGGVLKYCIMKPAQWGMIDLTVAGAVSGLGALVDVGFGIMAYAGARGSARARLLFWTLWPIHLSLSFLSFAKLEIILAMLLPVIGAFIAHRWKGRLLLGFVLTGIVFLVAQPFVHYGRSEVQKISGGSIDEANYAQRLSITWEYLFADNPVIDETIDDRQGWWTRLSYSGPQAYAMNAFDRGAPGSSLNETVWMYFVPRAIWPDKPIMTGPGLEFYRLVTGNEEGRSFLGLSIYGDLYWQFGWTGIVVGCPLIGWLFAMMASRSVQAIQMREFIMIPAVLLALQIAILGPTAFIVTGIVGPLPILIAYYVGTKLLLKYLRKLPK